MNEAIESQIKKMSPQFLVKNISASIEFYRSKLGFELAFFMKIFMQAL